MCVQWSIAIINECLKTPILHQGYYKSEVQRKQKAQLIRCTTSDNLFKIEYKPVGSNSALYKITLKLCVAYKG